MACLKNNSARYTSSMPDLAQVNSLLAAYRTHLLELAFHTESSDLLDAVLARDELLHPRTSHPSLLRRTPGRWTAGRFLLLQIRCRDLPHSSCSSTTGTCSIC